MPTRRTRITNHKTTWAGVISLALTLLTVSILACTDHLSMPVLLALLGVNASNVANGVGNILSGDAKTLVNVLAGGGKPEA